MNKIGKWICLIVLVSLLLVGNAPSETVYASGTTRHASPTGINTGTCGTWATACNLQRAITVAVSGNQVWVKQGIYKPSAHADRSATFTLRNGIAIYGGFAGTETLLNKRNWTTHVTTLSGAIGSASISDNSFHVVSATGVNNTAVLDGFTITAGNANDLAFDHIGAGMLNIAASPTLRNLKFSHNTATGGGGMYNYSGSYPTLTNVTFKNNQGTDSGGGMENENTSSPTLTNVIFDSNQAGAFGGGGMANDTSSSPTLTNVTFSSNTTSASGGGMENENSSKPILMNVTFFNNKADVYGAGMYNTAGSNASLTNVTFSHNTAANSGGGMLDDTSNPTLTGVTFDTNAATSFSGGGMLNLGSNPTLTNVTFKSNSAGSGGGGILNENSSAPTLMNVTFNGNSDALGGGAIYDETSSSPIIHDGIFWNDGTEFNTDGSSTPNITDSVIQNGCPSGSTCLNFINSDPFLVALSNFGGYTETIALGAGSSAIDTGGVNSTCAATDQRGVARPQGVACDIGAYEVDVMTFTSVSTYDGWVLESAKNSKVGSTLNSTATTFKVGDDSGDRRYRGVLSFNTDSLPNLSSVVIAQVRVQQQSIIGDPFATQGTLQADLVNPYFGSSLALAASDWQAAATVTHAGSLLLDGSSYWAPLNSSARVHINKTGTTQIRLHFSTDAYNSSADYLSLYAGNVSTSAYRPKLIVYYIPF